MGKLKINRVAKKYSDQENQLILYINFGYKEFDVIKNKDVYKPLRYYTGIRVHKNDWDSKRKEPVSRKVLNELMKFEESIESIFNYLYAKNNSVNPEDLKRELDIKFKGSEELNHTIGLVDYIREVLLKSRSNRKQITLKNYNRLANKLEDFQAKKGIILTAQNLNEAIYLDFMSDMKNQLNRQNSVWGVQKDLKAVLNEISRKFKIQVFHPTKDVSKSDKISIVTEENLYFDFDKIEAIIAFDPKNEKLKNVKLILLTLLFTGCRYSDVFKIKPSETYNKDGVQFRYARIISQKGSQELLIPILAPLEKAYQENDDVLPYPISDVKFNKYVKELTEAANLTNPVKRSFTNSFGEKEFEEKPFFEFVSSHIGRRSFITNLINHVPVTILGKITGHSLTNKNVIFSYNKISLLDNAVLMIKELKRIQRDYPKDFPITLVEP